MYAYEIDDSSNGVLCWRENFTKRAYCRQYISSLFVIYSGKIFVSEWKYTKTVKFCTPLVKCFKPNKSESPKIIINTIERKLWQQKRENHLCDAVFSNCANPLERMSGQFIWDRINLINKKSPLFCLNSMRLSAFYLICTLFSIWRHTGFSAFFSCTNTSWLIYSEKKVVFFLFLALLRFYCPKQTTQKHTFYNFSQWKKNCSRLHSVRCFFFLLS